MRKFWPVQGLVPRVSQVARSTNDSVYSLLFFQITQQKCKHCLMMALFSGCHVTVTGKPCICMTAMFLCIFQLNYLSPHSNLANKCVHTFYLDTCVLAITVVPECQNCCYTHPQNTCCEIGEAWVCPQRTERNIRDLIKVTRGCVHMAKLWMSPESFEV